jgi:16S rRNA (adenine1518-N6/adenine1519-N6)-dimethyltransferase
MASSDRRFMVDEGILAEIADSAGLSDGDFVLEVGGGTGNLTAKLMERCRVATVEKDRRLFLQLRRRFRDSPAVTVVHADAVRDELPPFNKIVSNIPYSVSRGLLERFIVSGFDAASLVVQREFAQKLAAQPPSDNYRMVSVLAQTTCDVEVLREIPPEAFDPKPRVASALVRLTQMWKPPREYITFLNSLFSQKNKKIRNIIEAPGRYSDMRPGETPPQALKALFLELNPGL